MRTWVGVLVLALVVTGCGGSPLQPSVDVFFGMGTTQLSDGDSEETSGAVAGEAFPLTYTLRSSGDAPLAVAGVSFGATTNCTAVVTQAPASLIAPDGESSFDVSITPTTPGAFTAQLLISTDDPNARIFTLTITGVAATSAPEIDVLGTGNIAIADGADVMTSGVEEGAVFPFSYTIRNLGNQPLTINSVTFGPHTNCSVALDGLGVTSVPAGGSTMLDLAYTVPGQGAFRCAVYIASNDADENPYDFNVTGSASASPFAPEIDVLGTGNVPIADGSDQAVTGVQAGDVFPLSYTIKNLGTVDPLTIGSVTFGPSSNCSISLTGLGTSSVTAGGSTMLDLTYTIPSAGAFVCAVHVASNDHDENPYDFNVTGTAAALVPEIDLRGTGNSPIADGGDQAITGVQAGDVFPLSYTIKNLGTGPLTLGSVTFGTNTNCSVTLNGLGMSTIPAGGSTMLDLTYTVPSTGAFTCAVHVASDDADENPYDFTASGTASPPPFAPEIDLLGTGNVPIADGGDQSITGVQAGDVFPLSYTIKNLGNDPLTIGSITFGTNTNCSVTLNGLGASTIPVGGSTMLDLTCTVPGTGAFICAVHIANNDANENPYDFTASGSAAALVPEIDVLGTGNVPISDGGDQAVTGVQAGDVFPLSYTIKNLGTGPLTIGSVTFGTNTNCSVSLTGLGSSTIPAGGSTTLDLTYTVAAAGAFVCSVHVANDDGNENPYDFTVTGTAAMSVAPEINLVGVADGGVDSAGTPFAFSPFDRTYTVQNLGAATLTLGALTFPTTTNCTISLITAPAATVAASGATSFTVRVTASGAGAFSCKVNLVNNDADENPYDFTISGTAH